MHCIHTDVLLLLTQCTPTHALPIQYSSELPAFGFVFHGHDSVHLLMQMSRHCASGICDMLVNVDCSILNCLLSTFVYSWSVLHVKGDLQSNKHPDAN